MTRLSYLFWQYIGVCARKVRENVSSDAIVKVNKVADSLNGIRFRWQPVEDQIKATLREGQK